MALRFIGHRLIAAFEIDDTETRMTQTGAGQPAMRLGVGATVAQGGGHRLNRLAGAVGYIADNRADAAHRPPPLELLARHSGQTDIAPRRWHTHRRVDREPALMLFVPALDDAR